MATLAYMCATNNRTLPPVTSFNWNWVDPAEMDTMSGVVAINRNTLGRYYLNLLSPIISQSCIKPWTSVSVWAMGEMQTRFSLTPYQTPQKAVIEAEGPDVVKISYFDKSDNSSKSGLTYGEFNMQSSYDCTVSFKGNTITIVQHLKLYVFVQWDYTSADGNVVDKIITDTYTLSVGQDGGLESKCTSSEQDFSQNPNFGWFMNFIADFQNIIESVKAHSKKVTATQFKSIPAQNIQNFVFPGAKVFTYKNVQFSDKQDLVSQITYVKPN
jgi:hypothetical protein